MFYELKETLRKNRLTENVYTKLRTFRHKDRFLVFSESHVEPQIDRSMKCRLNLIVPVFTNSTVFGGVSTALQMFNLLADSLKCERRIIVTGIETFSKQTYKVEGFKHNCDSKGIFFLSENRKILVRKHDIFLLTSWVTAYYFYPVFYWQRQMYQIVKNKVIYLIQDFEPGFYPWSAEYVLSESTYHHGEDTIAVFNSKELYQYIKKRKYSFDKELFFKPYLNPKLKECLLNRTIHTKRDKIIIFYGRPVDSRNAFGLIYSALMEWSKSYKDAKEWKIYSLGDKFDDIKLENNVIHFLGKLSLEDYANIMFSAYVGICLMVSPHPSYPPLEMSTFGVKTIVNRFEEKDLSSFNSNIISLLDYTPHSIANTLVNVCNQYVADSAPTIWNRDYIENSDFNNVINKLEELLRYDNCEEFIV